MNTCETATPPLAHSRVVAASIIIGTTLVALALPLWYGLGHTETARWLNQEDGPYEMTGALATLAAAWLIGWAAWRLPTHIPPSAPSGTGQTPSRGSGRLFLWLLALALLVMFGEEISWGQRIFSFATPEWFQQANIQREFNLHNLRLFHPELTSNRLKPLWMLASVLFLGLWPWLARRSARLTRWANRRGIPLASGAIITAACITFVAYVVVTRWAVVRQNLPIGHAMGEAAETAFELLYLLLAIEIWQRHAASVPRRTRRLTVVATLGLSLVAAVLMIAGHLRQQHRRAEAMRAIREAQTAIQQAQFSRAQAAAWRAVQCASDTPEAYFYLGVALFKQDMLDQAAQAFETALRLEPQAVATRRNLAAVLLKQGKPDEAARRLREGIALSDDAALRHLLGLALLRQGNRQAAERQFRRALQLDPRFQPAQAELQRLEHATP